MRRIPLLLLLAAGCGAPPPIQKPRTNLTIPPKWSAAEVPEGKVPADWWKGFDDPILAALLQEAVRGNPGLQAAAARIDRALARARIAGADQLPRVDGSFNAARRRQNFIGFPFPGGILRTIFSSYRLSLDVSWELDLWGRLGAGKSAALADAQAEAADFYAARLSLLGQVAKAYFAAVEARRQVDLSRATVAGEEAFTERIRDRYRRGLRPALDLRLSESNLASERARLHQREEQLDAALRRLEILLGRYPSGSIQVSESLPSPPGPVPAGLPSELLARRPDLVAAERRLAASGARLAGARAALYPSIRLTGSGGTASDQLTDLVRKEFLVWNIAADLLAPLFHGGRLRAGVESARADVRIALSRFADTLLRAFSEVEEALAAERFLALRERAVTRAAEEARAAHEIARRRYRAGLIDIVTLLESQRRAFEAESRRIAVRRLRLDARVNLILALGGGFERENPE